MSIWTFRVAFLLCFCTHLQIVLAKKGLIDQNPLWDWIESTGADPADKAVDKWSYSKGRKALTTEVEPGVASWFITPQLNLPNTSYLDMEASCNMNLCQLEIYGTDNGSPTNMNHEFIQNVTFGTQRLGQNTTIKKPYIYLCILARVLNTSAETTFYIHSIKIHHYFCEETSKYTTELRKLDSSTTNISKLVPCPDNAVSTDGNSTNITANCTPKGNWIFGKCVCTKGFYSNNEKCSLCQTDYYKNNTGNQGCQRCPEGKTNNTMHTRCKCKKNHYVGDDEDGPCYACQRGWYKSSVSNTKCTKCPANTVSVKDNTNCECKDGHYRLPSQSTTPQPCYAPIKIPVKPEVKEIKGSRKSVNITWLPPVNNSINETIVYQIKCNICDTDVGNKPCTGLSYNPSQDNVMKTYVRVSNLIHGQCYQFGIAATNSLNRVVSKDKWVFVSSDPYTFQSKDNAATVTSNTSNRIIIIVTTANAGFLLGIVLIVVLVELKRQKWCPRLPTPVDIPLETAETSPRSLQLPVHQEPDYEVARVVANDEEHYETISQYETYEEPNLSLQNPGYAELDKSQRRNSESNDYQKLQFPDLDYVIP